MGAEVDRWPPKLLEYLAGAHGRLVGVERLGGWSVAEVWLAHFEDGARVVVKGTTNPVEPAFYDSVAPRLRAAGIGIPELLGHLAYDGRDWLVLEHLPLPFESAPPDAWRPDPGIVSTLARLHAFTRGRDFDLPAMGAGRWTPEMTEACLSMFPAEVAARIAPVLWEFESQADALTDPWCWISGDPSPPNWGRRADGTLALFDWELFRPGVPATDLAITVPGLPSREMFALAAEAYLACLSGERGAALGTSIADQPARSLPVAALTRLPWSSEELVEQMCVAKVGTVVAMLAAQATGLARVPEETVSSLVRTVPGWMETLGEADSPSPRARGEEPESFGSGTGG
jgi:hypothetical protein